MIRLAPGTGDSAHGVRDDRGVVDEIFPEKRKQGKDNAGRVAAGRGDEFGRGYLIGADLRQPVNGALQQVGCGMGVPVEFLVNLRGAESEIRAQIDHPDAALEHGTGDLRGHSVGECEESDFRTGGCDVIGIGLRRKSARR